MTFRSSPQLVADYFRLFVNRRAYTVQSARPHPETGRHYHYRPTDRKNGAGLSLTAVTLRRHLEGEITIALYAINPVTQRCKWIAIDADYKNALEDLLKLNYYLGRDKVHGALEKSRRGGHLWAFFDTPLPARSCRTYVYDLALRLGVPVKGGSLPEGIEIFPKHDRLKPGEFGNAIRGPLGVHRGANRRYWFYGADYELGKQMAYLKGFIFGGRKSRGPWTAGPRYLLVWGHLSLHFAPGRLKKNISGRHGRRDVNFVRVLSGNRFASLESVSESPRSGR